MARLKEVRQLPKDQQPTVAELGIEFGIKERQVRNVIAAMVKALGESA